MRKSIKIWFHTGATSSIREISINKFFFSVVVVFFLGILIGLGYTGYDYYHLKKSSFDNSFLKTKITSQNNEIQSQRRQIQNFAGEINVLKKQVENLCTFEDKVRLIADIQQTSDSGGLFGIGGIPANDLDEDMPLDEKHNHLMREMHEQVDQTNFAASKQTQDFEELIKLLEKKKNILACTPSIKPTDDGWITSRFGYRKSPFTGRKEFHSGLDISNKSGKKVIATANGKVSYTGRKHLIGNLLIIDHGYGKVTKYGHLKEILVKKGQKVKRGDNIGLVGNSGRSTGPHLHYEIQINGTPVNPLKYILN